MADSKNKALPVGTVLRGAVYTYTVEKVLGQGSFGITYLASTLIKGPLGELPMPVAVKEFFAKDLDSRGEGGTVSARTEDGVAYRYAKAFQRESQNLSKMKHPGIVKVLEAFQTNGTYYYSMEYLPGGSLDDKVKGGGIPEEEALPIVEKIGEALAFMHRHKMMHLDLKPKNIMLKADGTPVIIDFGLSKQYDEQGEPESSTTIGLGTPGYAPIEQATQTTSGEFQPTLDIYALGATLYKMLTGKTPPAATLVLNKKAALEPELEVKNVSSRTVDAILKAMAPLMDDRPQRVEGFLSMLAGKSVEPEDKTEDETEPKHAPKPTPKPSTAPDPAPTPPGRKPKTWLWALLGGLAALAVVLALVFGGKDWIQGTGDDSGADTLAVAPPETFSEPSVAPSVNDSVPEAPGSIKITSEPAGAAIWLDGKNTGKKTPEILENVASGKHTVQLVLDGYTVYKGNVTVPSGGHTDVARTLTVKEKPYPKKGEATGSTRGTINGHEWVDLGLSVKWATCNVGASTPEAYGSYFAWGETSPKSEYTWENYKFHMSGDLLENITFGKYNTRSERGSVDNKTRLDLSDDAARVNWGGNWRMPTYYEWLDLYTECTWTWTSLGGKNGYEVVSKKNGNSIFLPAAGYQDDDNLANVGTNGFYWSSSLFTDNPNNAWNIYVNSRTVNSYRYNRYYGFSVRPVSK